MTSAELTPMYTQAQLGNGGYNANASVGAFFHWERVDSVTINLYEYCLGHGVAGWEISTAPHRIRLKGLTTDPAEITIAKGDTATIQAILNPANAETLKTSWRYAKTNRNSKLSSDGNSAKFTSKTLGTYTITVTVDDFTAECIVNVVEDATGVDNTTTVTLEPCKQIVNGQVLIRTQDGTYTLMGQEL